MRKQPSSALGPTTGKGTLTFRPGHVAAVLVILLAAPSAQAASKEAEERAARKACLSGDYAKGVEILSDLFIDTKNVTYLYNQGRCFEQNNRYDEALGRFREYLRLGTSLTSAERAEAEKHVADCQALLPSSPASTPPGPGEGGAAVSPPPSSPLPAQALPSSYQPRQPDVSGGADSTTNPGRGLRIAGIACGALGLASVGAGIYYYTQAQSYSDKVSKQPIHDPSDVSAGKDAETMQWVFYAVGGTAIATGTVLYVLGWSSANKNPTITGVSPLLSPGIAGISAQGVF